jgi:hypothetical protein
MIKGFAYDANMGFVLIILRERGRIILRGGFAIEEMFGLSGSIRNNAPTGWTDFYYRM